MIPSPSLLLGHPEHTAQAQIELADHHPSQTLELCWRKPQPLLQQTLGLNPDLTPRRRQPACNRRARDLVQSGNLISGQAGAELQPQYVALLAGQSC
jgi:hypothetical protein